MFLGHEDALVCAVPIDIEAEEVRGWTTIGAFKGSIESSFEFVEIFTVIRRD